MNNFIFFLKKREKGYKWCWKIPFLQQLSTLFLILDSLLFSCLKFLIFKFNQTIKSDFNTIQKRKFEAKCDECGQKAIVPFKPTARRKVFCKDCYSKQQSNNPRNYHTKHSFNTNIAWARRTKTFSGRKEKKPTSIFHK